MAWGPDRRLYVTEDTGLVVVARPGRKPLVVARGLRTPLGLAWRGRELYVSEQGRLGRYTLQGSKLTARTILVRGLPFGLHQQDSVVVGPDNRLYLGSGSTCDACREQNPRSATILSMKPDGSDVRVVARGLRNPFGLAFQPGTSKLYASVNGQDKLGTKAKPEPAESVVLVRRGAFYGWPRCWPSYAKKALAGRCRGVTPPVAYLEPHSSADGLAFWRGDLFVALWGQYLSDRHGRKLVRVHVGPPQAPGDDLRRAASTIRSRSSWTRAARCSSGTGVEASFTGSLVPATDTFGFARFARSLFRSAPPAHSEKGGRRRRFVCERRRFCSRRRSREALRRLRRAPPPLDAQRLPQRLDQPLDRRARGCATGCARPARPRAAPGRPCRSRAASGASVSAVEASTSKHRLDPRLRSSARAARPARSSARSGARSPRRGSETDRVTRIDSRSMAAILLDVDGVLHVSGEPIAGRGRGRAAAARGRATACASSPTTRRSSRAASPRSSARSGSSSTTRSCRRRRARPRTRCGQAGAGADDGRRSSTTSTASSSSARAPTPSCSAAPTRPTRRTASSAT